MVEVEKKPYKGLKFTELEKLEVPVEATLTINATQKYELKGFLTVDCHRNSWKYQDEGVITVWSYDKPILKNRPVDADKQFFRIEIPVPIPVLYDFLMNACMKLDARRKGIV